jgi:hypothetical protein
METRTAVHVVGVDADQLATMRSTGIDHGGNRVQPFVDTDGGWPLRCCLTDSSPGDTIAIIAWSPFPWDGAYAELGPIVVHAEPCAGYHADGVPPQFEQRRQLLRPYGRDRRIVYDAIRIVGTDESLAGAIAVLLERGDVDFVHARNVLSGCYSFTAARPGEVSIG